MQVWELGPGRLMVAGVFSDLAVHHHPAVQVTVGGRGCLTVTRDGDVHDVCRLVVVGSGARHAVRSDSSGVPVSLSRQADLPHAYLNFVGIGGRFAEAAGEAAEALRLGLAAARPKLRRDDEPALQ
jgi:hypothetical protein